MAQHLFCYYFPVTPHLTNFFFRSELLTLSWPWWWLYYVSNIFQHDLMQWIMSLLALRVEDMTLYCKAMKWIWILIEGVSKWVAFYKPVFLQWKCWFFSEIILIFLWHPEYTNILHCKAFLYMVASTVNPFHLVFVTCNVPLPWL